MGVSIQGGDPAFVQRARYNAIFAATPLRVGEESGNIVGSLEDAAGVFRNATATPDSGLDLHPRELDVFSAEVTDIPNETTFDFFGRTREVFVAGALGMTDGPPLTLQAPAVQN